MQNPHKILGVSLNASKKEIKKAYRKLSKQYHPDVNSNSSYEKFILIKEAYEFLYNETQQIKKRNSNKDDLTTRMNNAKRRYNEIKYKEYVDQQKFFQNLFSSYQYKFFQCILIFVLCLSLLLFVDYLIPGKWKEAKIVTINYNDVTNSFTNEKIFGIHVDNEKMYAPYKQISSYKKNNFLALEKGRLTKINKRIAIKEGKRYLIINTPFGYSSTILFVHFILIIPLIAFLIRHKKNTAFLFFYRFSIFIVPVFLLIMLICYI